MLRRFFTTNNRSNVKWNLSNVQNTIYRMKTLCGIIFTKYVGRRFIIMCGCEIF